MTEEQQQAASDTLWGLWQDGRRSVALSEDQRPLTREDARESDRPMEKGIRLCNFVGGDLQLRLAPARAGDVRHSRGDISRARAELGFAPKVGFEEGLARTLEWYKQS